MKYYLRHYFDPDLDHLNLKPKLSSSEDDGMSMYNLGYVQNVIRGQVLAEVIPMEMATADHDPRYEMDEPELPGGPNTWVDERYPHYLLSTVNGYVFYHEGKITVKHLLNVRSDVSFQTGNIFFVGDMMVHGSVLAGFEAQANHVRVKNMVEGGRVRSRGDMLIEGGARGGQGQNCKLISGGKIVCPFVEKVELRANDAIVVEKYCLYSDIYAGSNLVVQESLYGCTVNAYRSVYVGKQLGNRAAVPTKVYLGYSPDYIHRLERLDARIQRISEREMHLTRIAGHLGPETPNGQKLQRVREQRAAMLAHRDELWTQLQIDQERVDECRVIVPGVVYPGVEISIGRAFMEVTREYSNVCFQLSEEDIIVVPNGAAVQ